MWPRFKAVAHPECAFEFLWGHFVWVGHGFELRPQFHEKITREKKELHLRRETRAKLWAVQRRRSSAGRVGQKHGARNSPSEGDQGPKFHRKCWREGEEGGRRGGPPDVIAVPASSWWYIPAGSDRLAGFAPPNQPDRPAGSGSPQNKSRREANTARRFWRRLTCRGHQWQPRKSHASSRQLRTHH